MKASGISASDLRSPCRRARRAVYSSTAAPARSARSLPAVSRPRSRRGGGRHLGLADQRLQRRARLRGFAAALGDRGSEARGDALRAPARGARSASACSACARRSRASASFAARRSAASCSAERLAAASASRRSAAIRRSRARSKARRAPRAASSAALSADAAARTAACALSASARSRSARRGPRRHRVEVAEAVPASRRAAAEGASAAAVKPSQRQIALARDEPLAGPEPRPQGGAVIARDDADLRQPPLQRIRPLHEIRQRAHALGQGGVVGAVAVQRPMHRRRGGRGAFEILAERRAERRFVALRDGNEVEHLRPHVVGARGEELGRVRTSVSRRCAARSASFAGPRLRASASRAPASTLRASAERSSALRSVSSAAASAALKSSAGGARRRAASIAARSRSTRARSAAKRAARSFSSRRLRSSAAFRALRSETCGLQLAELASTAASAASAASRRTSRPLRGFGAGAVAGQLLALALEPRDRRGAVGLGGILAGDVAARDRRSGARAPRGARGRGAPPPRARSWHGSGAAAPPPPRPRPRARPGAHAPRPPAPSRRSACAPARRQRR